MAQMSADAVPTLLDAAILATLPDDMWEEIFRHLDRDNSCHMKPISLVCKRFLAISNRTCTTLSTKLMGHSHAIVFSRFRRLHTVNFHSYCHSHNVMDLAITELAESGLPLRAFSLNGRTYFPREALRLLGCRMSRTLRSLSFRQIYVMTDEDLAAVADSFPYLENLDIENSGFFGCPPVSDQGILWVSLKLKSLVSISLGWQRRLTPLSLHHLSSNCPSIRDLHAELSVDFPVELVDDNLPFTSLTSLHLAYANISESTLHQLSKANLKLSKLALIHPRCSDDMTGAAFCRFLKSCRTLCHLELEGLAFPTVMSAIDFVASIPNIHSIRLRLGACTMLPEATFFYLLRDCPDLEEIDIDKKCPVLVFDDISVRYRLRKLVLGFSPDLTDKTLALIGAVCPKLEVLCIAYCPLITNQGLEAVTTKCRNLKHLSVKGDDYLDSFISNK